MLYAPFLLSKSPQRAFLASNRAGVGSACFAQACAVKLGRTNSKAPVEPELPPRLVSWVMPVLGDKITLSVIVSASLQVKPKDKSSARACVLRLAGVEAVKQVFRSAGGSVG